MSRLRFPVIMLAWGMAARGAELSDADSAMAARIELLRDANAKMQGRLEKIRGAISYWAEQGFTADNDGASEDEGPAASAEPAGAPGRGRRLQSQMPGGVKVWQGGVLHNFKNAATCLPAWSKLDSCACSGPAWRLRVAPYSQSGVSAHRAPSYGLEPAATCPALYGFQARATTPSSMSPTR